MEWHGKRGQFFYFFIFFVEKFFGCLVQKVFQGNSIKSNAIFHELIEKYFLVEDERIGKKKKKETVPQKSGSPESSIYDDLV